jgi:hypothetical protein
VHEINYDADAVLMILEFGSGYVRSGPVFRGPLVQAVNEAMQLPASERERATINVGADSGLDTTLLNCEGIEALHQRSDFPRD